MPFDIDPELIENNDVRITTDANDRFILENKRSGDTIEMDSSGTVYTDSINTEKIPSVVDKFVDPQDDDLETVLEGASAGDVIFLKRGTHSLSAKPTIDGGDALTVCGVGRASVISQTADDYGLEILNSDDVAIRNLRLEGNADDTTTEGSSTETAIGFTDNCADATVENVWITNWDYDGIHALKGCIGHTYDTVRIFDVGDDGINPGGQGSTSNGNGTKETTISNCRVVRANNDAYHISIASKKTILSGTRSRDCGGASIALFECHDLEISGHTSTNDFRGIQTRSAGSEGLDHVSGSDILIDSPDNHGLWFEHGHSFDLDVRVKDAGVRSVYVDGDIPEITLDIESFDPSHGTHVQSGGTAQADLRLSGRLVGGDRGLETAAPGLEVSGLTLDGVSGFGLVLNPGTSTDLNASITGLHVNGGISNDIVYLDNAMGVSISGFTSEGTSAGNAVNETNNADENVVTGYAVDAPINLLGTNSVDGDGVVKA